MRSSSSSCGTELSELHAASYTHTKTSALLDLLRDSDSAARYAAAIALVHVAQLRGFSEEDFERFTKDEDERVRYWASFSIKIQNTMPTPKLAEDTAQLLASPDPISRFAAVLALVHLGDAGALY